MRKYWMLAAMISFAAPCIDAIIEPSTAQAQTIAEADVLRERFDKAITSVDLKKAESIQQLLYLEPFDAYIDPNVTYAAFATIAQKATDPALARYAEWRMTKASEQLGKKTSTLPGEVSGFFVSYPYENASLWGFSQQFAAEKGFDTSKPAVDATFDGVWQTYRSTGHAGLNFPQEAVYIDEFGVVYMATRIFIEAPKPVHARLEIASSTPVTAWVNGTAQANQKTLNAERAPLFGPSWNITLNPGENTLVLKVASLETKPSLRVFLTDAKGAPLSFKTDISKPIVSDALKGVPEDLKPASDSLYQTWLRDESLSPALRAKLANKLLNNDESEALLRDLLMRDLAKTAALPVADILLAVSSLSENWMKLEILRAALKQYPKDPWINFSWASADFNAASGDSSPIRFVDILPKLKKHLEVNIDPMLSSILNANIQMAMRQQLSARSILDNVSKDTNNGIWLSTYLSTVRPRYERDLYLQLMSKLYNIDKTSSFYLVELCEARLMDAKASHNPTDIAEVLVTIQNDVEEYLSRHPYDDNMWEFWLNIVDAYALDILVQKGEDVSAYQSVGWNIASVDVYERWIMLKPNDPDRWARYAAFSTTMGDIENSETAYAMASVLRPQDDTLKQRSQYKTSTTEPKDRFETPYLVTDIPGNRDASAASHVSLLDQRIMRIMPNGLTSTYNQLVFEVLDEAGVRALRAVPINYSPTDEQIEIVSVTTTHKDGSVKRIFKTSEYNVADPSIRMYFDQRQIVVEVPDLSVGDRVDFQFRRTETHRSASSIPFFGTNLQLQSSFNKQWSRYIVIAPKDLPVHFYKHNPDLSESATNVTTKQTETETITIFEEKDVPRILFEEHSPGITEIAPFLVISSFDSWQQVADWFIELAKPQWIADDAIRAEVKRLTQGVTDRREIVRILYNYVLQETRYVALEFGIHGHKPYPVPQIFQRKFGDCKDKASLLKVMLETAGIETKFVLLRTTQNGEIDTKLPSPYMFDHAIAYVPEFDLFLDGTAEFNGSDELPSADQGAIALIVSDDASYTLRKTPVSNPEDNVSINEKTFDLTPFNGSIAYQGHIQFAGDDASFYRSRYSKQEGQADGENTQIQLARLKDDINNQIPGSDLISANFGTIDNREKNVDITYEAKVDFNDIAIHDAEQTSVLPLMRSMAVKRFYTSGASRKFPLELDLPTTYEAGIKVILPTDKKADLPAETAIENDFGSFRLTFTPTNNGYAVRSIIKFKKRRIQPHEYSAWQDFLSHIDVALNTRITIR